ncbi:MAG: asparagine synthetase B family protein, partial [Sciscionella sp.]
FLSGGIDSSGLAALMAPMMNGPLQTFSVGFAEQGYNELSYARLAAQSVRAEHREITLSAVDFFKVLPRLLWHEDEPIAFSSSVCLYFVSRLASEYVKVVMTGEGADELFLGYNRYRVTAWNHRLGRPYWAVVPRRMREAVSGMIGHFPRALRRYAERSFLGPAAGIRGMFYENFAVFPQFRLQALLLSWDARRDPYAEGLNYYNQAPGNTLERMSYADMQTYMVELLMKQDQMSMAASIESRVPFLDHKLVEQVAAMPGRYKLRGWQTKAVLREALRDLVPKQILTRRKMGFPVPLGRWFRGAYAPLMQDLVMGKRALSRGLFDPGYVGNLVTEHRSGAFDHSERLWMLMNLEIWQRIFLDGEVPEAVTDQVMRKVDLSAAA